MQGLVMLAVMCITQVMYKIPRYCIDYRMVLGDLHNFTEYLDISGIVYITWPLLGNLGYLGIHVPVLDHRPVLEHFECQMKGVPTWIRPW